MRKIIPKFLFLFFIIIAWTAVVFLFAYDYGYNQIPEAPRGLNTSADVSILWDVWNKLTNKYIGEVDEQKLIYGAAKGMAESVGDPYTAFFKPSDSEVFKDDISGSFEGVGIEIIVKEGVLTVVAPLEGTPGDIAGILPGDKIIKVGEVKTKDLSIEEIIKIIRGEKGTPVDLSIMREGWSEIKVFTIIRDEINVSSVVLDFLEDGKIAKLRISQFAGNLDLEMKDKARKIVQSGAEKIILDLRNNTGGLLSEAQKAAGWFIKAGSIVTIEKSASGEERKYLATGNELLENYPIIILINGGTASAAEILAAALRDNRNDVKLIGETSFGKGSVQEPIDIRGGALLKVTVAHWLTPSRKLIDKEGLKPDIEVKLTEEDYKENKDPQLEEAIKILN
jgi:carboxyl-terminal processing protease